MGGMGILTSSGSCNAGSDLLRSVGRLLSRPRVHKLVTSCRRRHRGVRAGGTGRSALGRERGDPLDSSTFSVGCRGVMVRVTVGGLSETLNSIKFFRAVFFRVRRAEPIRPQELRRLLAFLLGRETFSGTLRCLGRR